MKKNIVKIAFVILAMVFPLLSTSDTFGQDMGTGNHREGYGSYNMMGQSPDEILKYGHEMMRYGFHETGMRGGSSRYPGYNSNLRDDTVKSLNAEQEAFIKDTESLRHTIYEKELYLKAELAKKSPDMAIALSFQTAISEAQGDYEQKMIAHLIRMKKINLEAERE